MKYHHPICRSACSIPNTCAACVIGNAPDHPIAQNNVALAHLHFGVRNLGNEHSVAAVKTIRVIYHITSAQSPSTPHHQTNSPLTKKEEKEEKKIANLTPTEYTPHHALSQ
jgi:hypothetical protein